MHTFNYHITTLLLNGLRDYGLEPVYWPAVTFSPMAGLPPLTIPEQVCCLGLEKDIWSYVGHLVAVFREVKRVMRDDGVLWLNLGDSYASGGGFGGQGKTGIINNTKLSNKQGRAPVTEELKPKDLMGIPWRVAYALQADGWWLRSDVIWCLSGGTWIYTRTRKGDMPMMVRDAARLDPKTIKLWNGEKWTQVLGWSRTSRNADELEIVLRSGERISCTPTHQFPTNRGLLAASELQVGDVLQSVRLPEPETPYNPAIVPCEAAWFIGLYLAEGSKSGDTIQITGHVKEDERLERVKKIAEFYGGSATFTNNENNQNIRIHGRFLNALIDQYISGKTAKDKGLKVRCWSHSNEWLRSLLNGYLSGDGHWDKQNGRWRLGFTRNYNLERDLRVLCARLGLSLTLNLSTTPYNGRKVATFRGEIRFNPSRSFKTEIMKIRKARCREVYDIGVEDEPHLFTLASGVLTHNSKPNPMPESVTDRPTKAHEYVFLLSGSEKYFYDAEAIREDGSKDSHGGGNPNNHLTRKSTIIHGNSSHSGLVVAQPAGESGRNRRTVWTTPDEPPFETFQDWLTNKLSEDTELYRTLIDEFEEEQSNKSDVWQIATKPYSAAHFATFPPKLIEPMILASTSQEGVCGECGNPWRRVVEKVKGEDMSYNGSSFNKGKTKEAREHLSAVGEGERTAATVTTGWQPSCTHNAPIVPAVILDPFFGSGTTGEVAIKHRRNYIGIEANPAYGEGLAGDRLDGVQIVMGLES